MPEPGREVAAWRGWQDAALGEPGWPDSTLVVRKGQLHRYYKS